MGIPVKLAAWAVLLLASSPLAFAQHAGSGHVIGASGPMSPTHTRPVVAGAPASAGHAPTTRRSSSRTLTAAVDGNGFLGAPLTPLELLNPFPGYGFSFEHLNSINYNINPRAATDPLTQARLANAQRLLRDNRFVGAPGFFLLDGGGAYAYPPGPAGPDQGDQSTAAPAQQQVIVAQAPSNQQTQASDTPPDDSDQDLIPDVGEFTLVLRNGTSISAIAFTRVNDRIVYITPDGSRRTVAASEIDSDATERTNQERGTPLQLTL